jgi:ABC-type glycerol-3-phosphate transport system permease component
MEREFGASFWSIALPAIQPALETAVLLDLLTHWSKFLRPLLMSTRVDTRTVQVALAGLFTALPVDWGAILACAVLSTLPVLCAFRFSSALCGAERRARRYPLISSLHEVARHFPVAVAIPA